MEAQDALIEYLHSTRNSQYLDAKNMHNSKFAQVPWKVAEKFKKEKDAKQSLRRLFCDHPID